MAINFSANQYEGAFEPQKIQNWEVPKDRGNIVSETGPSRHYSTMPGRRIGFSQIHANNRGHLLPNVPRRRESPWGTFVGTWDMPCHIPGNKSLNPTARSEDVLTKMQTDKEEKSEKMSGALKKCKLPDPLPVRVVDEDFGGKSPMIEAALPFSPSMGKLQRLTAPTLPPNHEVEWPKQGGEDQPVGGPSSPKPPTPMNVAGESVQQEAARRVSPVNTEAVAVRGMCATPVDQVTGMRTPMAGVNWPMARGGGSQRSNEAVGDPTVICP